MLRKLMPWGILLAVILQVLPSTQAYAASLTVANMWKPSAPSYAWKPYLVTPSTVKPTNNQPTVVQTTNYAWKPQPVAPVTTKPVTNQSTTVQMLTYAWKTQPITPVTAKPANNLLTTIQLPNYAWKPQPAVPITTKPTTDQPTVVTVPTQPIEQQPVTPAPVAPVTELPTTITMPSQPTEQQPVTPAPVAPVTEQPAAVTMPSQPTEQQPVAPVASITDQTTAGTAPSQPIEQQPVIPVTATPAQEQPIIPSQPVEQQAITLPEIGQYIKNLLGKIIVLDPGHGGSNPGAVANGVKEADINLAVSLNLREKLVEAGANVIMTRETNRTVAPEGQTLGQELQARVDIAEMNNADIFVSIHSNDNPDSSIAGAMSFYPQGKASDLASAVQKSIIQAAGAIDKGIETATFYVLRKTSMPSVLIEIGFLSNPEEAVRLQDNGYRTKIVQGIFNGIVTYFSTR